MAYLKAYPTSFARGRSHTLTTALSPTECAERLCAAINGQSRAFADHWINDSPTIWGSVSNEAFLLSSSVLDGTPFKTFAVGTIHPTPNGSKIEVRLSVHPEAWKIVILWVGTLILLPVLALYSAADLLRAGIPSVKALAIDLYNTSGVGFVVAAALGLFYPLGRWASKELDTALTRFLVRTLEANEGHDRSFSRT